MSSLGFTSKEQRNLGLLVHLMTSNPKILYAPAGSEADRVILKVRLPCSLQAPTLGGAVLVLGPELGPNGELVRAGPVLAGCPRGGRARPGAVRGARCSPEGLGARVLGLMATLSASAGQRDVCSGGQRDALRTGLAQHLS